MGQCGKILLSRRIASLTTRLQTYTQNMKYLLLFQSNNGYAHVPRRPVIRTVPVLLYKTLFAVTYGPRLQKQLIIGIRYEMSQPNGGNVREINAWFGVGTKKRAPKDDVGRRAYIRGACYVRGTWLLQHISILMLSSTI